VPMSRIQLSINVGDTSAMVAFWPRMFGGTP
jgi:hypothetical protein